MSLPRNEVWKQAIADAKELLNGFDELPGLHQVVGKLGARLRRCKCGGIAYKETWDKMTEFENKAADIRSAIRLRVVTLLARMGE